MSWYESLRRRFGTLRWRIALWIAGFVALTLALLEVSVYFSMVQKLHGMVDDTLRLSAIQIAAAVDIEGGQIWTSEGLPELAPAASGLDGRSLLIRIYDSDGTLLAEFGPPSSDLVTLPPRNPALNSALNPVASSAQSYASGFATFVQADGRSVRMYTTPLQDNNQVVGTLQVGEDLSLVNGALDQLSAALTMGALLLVVLSVAGGYFLAGRALAPVAQITRTVQHISTHDLTARLALPAGDDELGRLAHTLDAMLDRLEEGFRRERQFTADASHELRTPLAAMQAILDVVRARPRSNAEYCQALDDLAEETDRLQQLAGDLLHLAHSDAAHGVPVCEPVNLAQLLQDVCESMQPLAHVKGLTLDCVTPPVLIVMGDGDELVRMFVNLVDNAIKYTDQGGIKIDVAECEHGRRVTVADTGSGIAPEHLPHVFDRFYRADAARSLPGSGLGLAIAATIASAHGGAIDVASAPHAGTQFVVTLPRKRPDEL